MDRNVPRRKNMFVSPLPFPFPVHQTPPILFSPTNLLHPGTLGISTYAAKALGDVVYIELPSTSLEISSGDAIGAVESVKSASDILSPVGGKVVEVNKLLEEKPGEINKDPEGEAWIARIEVEGGAEVEGLMSKDEYKEFTVDE